MIIPSMSSDNIPAKVMIPVKVAYSRLFGCRKCGSIGECDYCSIYEAEVGIQSWWRLCEVKNPVHLFIEATDGQIELLAYDLRQMRDNPDIPFYVLYDHKFVLTTQEVKELRTQYAFNRATPINWPIHLINEDGYESHSIIPIYFQFDRTLNTDGSQICIGIELSQDANHWFAKYLKN